MWRVPLAGKDDLVAAVVADVFSVARAEVGPGIRGAGGPREQLTAYVTERIRFLATHGTSMRALLDIAISGRTPDRGQLHPDVGPEPALRDLEALLTAGQDQGFFRDVAVRPMALTISQAIDGVLLQLASRPDIDLELRAREISTAVDLAMRSSTTA